MTIQIKKTYKGVNPELLLAEVRDLILKQGVVLDQSKLETYSTPGATVHISRGILSFKIAATPGEAEQECIRVHIIGSAMDNTKVLLDVDNGLFPPDKVKALEEDMVFIFGSYETH
ncbi:MAG: hypothetical protein HY669_02410 [Chloroflexi bacterium]|nr:hypothetical protein [Chloroflexota bacterium]